MIVLPELPNVINLCCAYNQLTELPELPLVTDLVCHNNQLTQLPELSLVEVLYCYNNQLTELPELPLVEDLHCRNNQLRFQSMHYKYIHQIRKVAIALSVIKQWRKFNQESIKIKKQGLHIELLYSPDLPFYLQQPEAQHWFDQMN